MKRSFLSIMLAAMATLCVSAQTTDGVTSDVTVFHNYCPAVITLTSGHFNHQQEANIFLKDGALLYKQGGTVMSAKMDMISSVRFGDREFINVENQLAEVIDTCGGNSLVLIRLINIDELKKEFLNESTITNIHMGDQLSVTRLEATADQLNYPIDNKYLFLINGKTVLAHERNARRAAGRKRLKAYDALVNSPSFRWSDPFCLKQLLQLFSE